MDHLSHKMHYLLRTVLHNPLELLRLVRVGFSTFRYRYLSRCADAGTVIGERTVFVNSANIHIGPGCLVQDRVYIRAGVDGKVEIGRKAAINSHVQIYGHGGVYVGEESQIGPNTLITTTGHDYKKADLDRNFAPVTIGNRVWIGANCTILPGVSIGDFSVVGAGSVVNKNVPPRTLVVGVPARVVRAID